MEFEQTIGGLICGLATEVKAFEIGVRLEIPVNMLVFLGTRNFRGTLVECIMKENHITAGSRQMIRKKLQGAEMTKPENSSGTSLDSTSHKKNQVDSEAVVRLFVESVRQKRKKQTPGVKRTRSGIVSKLCHEVGITRAMALFMLKDMHQYKIKDIEPRYLRDTKKKKGPQSR